MGYSQYTPGMYSTQKGITVNEYVPEMRTIQKDIIYSAIHAVTSGLEYAQECLKHHENKRIVHAVEEDIRQMNLALTALRGTVL